MKLKVAELVFDFDLYPRGNVDSQRISYFVEALRAGVEFPPITIERKTKRIVDGFHRARAYARYFDEQHEIEVEAKTYKSDADLFYAAGLGNASHGMPLDTHDRTHCIIRGRELGLEPNSIAKMLNVTTEKVESLIADRIGFLEAPSKGRKAKKGQTPEPQKNGAIALKFGAHHLAGKVLTKGQQEGLKQLGGNRQVFYVNQVILLIEKELLDKSDGTLMQRLGRLKELLEIVVPEQTADT